MKKIFVVFIFLLTCLLIHPKVVSAQLVYSTSFENATTNARGWYLNLDPDPHYGVPLSNYINGDGHQWVEGVESRPNAIFPSNFPGPHSGNRCLGFYYLNGSTTEDRSGMALWTNPWAGTVNENPYQAQHDLTDNEFYISEWFFLPNFTLASTKDQWYGLFQYSNILGDAYPYYQFEILGHTGHASLVPANTLVAVLDWRDESGLQHYYQPYQNFQSVLPIGRWFKFEWYTLRDATNGTIKVWVDGIKIFDISGINTKHVTLPDYPEPNGEPYSIDNARIYMGTDSNPHWLFVDDIEIWNGMPGQQELATLYGKLINKTGSPIQATISVGSINNNTLSDGNYSIQVPKGIYDINYSTQNLWIKLLSFNLSSDQKDLVNYITKNSSENKLYFTANITGNQTIQTYSSKKPLRVLVNGTAMTEVLSYSQLTNNTWYYDSNNLYMNPISGGSGGGGCGCTNWTNQGCGLSGCASNQQYQIRTCSPSVCANTSQCVYNSSCVPTCSDGTQYNQCSSNKPKYCDNGNLTDKCSVCNCPTGYSCLANESCNLTVDYYIVGSGGSYTATNSSGQTIFTDTNAATLINKVFNMMTAGQTVAFNGTFRLTSTLNPKNNTNLLLGTSELHDDASIYVMSISEKTGITFDGGHFISHATSTVAIGGYVSTNITVQNGEFEGFDAPGAGIVLLQGGRNFLVQNCHFHDNPSQATAIANNEVGSSKFLNNTIERCFQGMGIWNYASDDKINNEIAFNTLIDANDRGIYIEGTPNCSIHDNTITETVSASNSAGIMIKSPNTTVFNNDVRNQVAGISIYAQHGDTGTFLSIDGSRIYNNTFLNNRWGIYFGESEEYNETNISVYNNSISAPTPLTGTGFTNGIMLNMPHGQTLSNVTIKDNQIFNLGIGIGWDYGGDTIATNGIKILRNTFTNISTIVIRSYSASTVNTTVAYNDFTNAHATTILQDAGTTNTMVYNNTGLADKNVPPVKIPPP